MSKWDGRGSPDTRGPDRWEVEMELRAMREAEGDQHKGESFMMRRFRKNREAQEKQLYGGRRYG